MPFGLKLEQPNRRLPFLFYDIMHEVVECYVDDLVVKTRRRTDHLADLKQVFERLRVHQLKMNLLKCAFGLSSGRFLSL